jgi:hypothetical protein
MTTFQVGDKVCVKRTMTDWEHWQSDMSDLLGKTGTITSTFHYTEDIPSVNVDGDCEDYWFPTECLELVAAAPQEFTITEPLQDYERF